MAALVLSALLGACFPPALTEGERTDAGIRARLEQQFKAHRELDLHMVTLDVHNHNVTLSGMVNSFQDKRLLERIVAGTPGIEQALVNVIYPQ